MAALEEWLQEKYVEYYDEVDQYVNKVELLSNKLTDLLLTNSSSRKYTIYEGKTYYLLNKKSLPKEIKEGLVGGDSNKVEEFSRLIDIYGITTDLKVYYIDTSNGIQYGDIEVEDVNPDLVMPKLNNDKEMNNLIKEALRAIGVEIDEEKGVTIDNVSKIGKLTIDGSKVNIKNLDALSELLNLQELTLKNITLSDLTGIEGLGLLNYIYFDNCKITDYSKMASVYGLKYLYFYFPNSMVSSDANNQITRFGEGLSNATRIKGLEYLYILGNNTDIFISAEVSGWSSTANGFFTYSNNSLSNLTDISGLERLPENIKGTVKELYLNNHKITSISSLSGFTGLQNLIMPCNPELHSLEGLENKTNLLYLAGQQPILNENAGKIRSDMGFENLDGLQGCSGLIYLVLFNNTKLQSISGIKSSSSLARLYCNNCNIISSDGLQGTNETGLDKLLFLDLVNNVNLGRVRDIELCDNIVELYLAGNINMTNDEAIGLESVILRCGSKYSIPQKYSLGFKSVTSQDISGTDFSDSQLENFKDKTNIKRLRLKNCTALTNNKINEVLKTMTGLQYLSLEGTKNLTSIEFVDSMSLIEFNINGTSVTNLNPLNDSSSNSLTSFWLTSTTIDTYTTLLTNLCNNAGKKNYILTNTEGNLSKTIFDRDSNNWGNTNGYASAGLILSNPNQVVNIPEDVNAFCVGCFCSDTTFDLSNCTKLKNIYLGGPSGKFIFPSSLEYVKLEYRGKPILDFSACNKLVGISLTQGGDDSWASTIFNSLPESNIVRNLEIRRAQITNLSFLESLGNLQSLLIGGFGVSNVEMTKFTTLKGIENATNLTTVTVEYAYLKDLTGLDSLTNLTYLKLQYNKLDSSSQVSNIAKCTKLTELYLNNNEVSSIDFMSSLIKLKTAVLNNNSFSTIPDLSKLTVLETLNISNCSNITDLKLLEKIIINNATSLRTLDLTNCSGIEATSGTTGYSNSGLIDKLRKAGCTNIKTSGTRL